MATWQRTPVCTLWQHRMPHRKQYALTYCTHSHLFLCYVPQHTPTHASSHRLHRHRAKIDLFSQHLVAAAYSLIDTIHHSHLIIQFGIISGRPTVQQMPIRFGCHFSFVSNAGCSLSNTFFCVLFLMMNEHWKFKRISVRAVRMVEHFFVS